MSKNIFKMENIKTTNECLCFSCKKSLENEWHTMIRFDNNFIHLCNDCTQKLLTTLEIKQLQAENLQKIEKTNSVF